MAGVKKEAKQSTLYLEEGSDRTKLILFIFLGIFVSVHWEVLENVEEQYVLYKGFVILLKIFTSLKLQLMHTSYILFDG